MAVRFLAVKSPLYLTENLPRGRLPLVLWCWHVGLLSQKRIKNKKTNPPSPNLWASRNHQNMVHHHWKSDLDYFMQKHGTHYIIQSHNNVLWNTISPREHCYGYVWWELGLAFSSSQLSTQVPSITFKKCCHLSIRVILGTPCEVVKSPTSMVWMVEIAWIDLKWLGT